MMDQFESFRPRIAETQDSFNLSTEFCNLAVLGASGSGKSATIANIVSQSKGQFIICDFCGEYASFFDGKDGRPKAYIATSPGELTGWARSPKDLGRIAIVQVEAPLGDLQAYSNQVETILLAARECMTNGALSPTVVVDGADWLQQLNRDAADGLNMIWVATNVIAPCVCKNLQSALFHPFRGGELPHFSETGPVADLLQEVSKIASASEDLPRHAILMTECGYKIIELTSDVEV